MNNNGHSNNGHSDRTFLRTAEAAEILCISKNTLYKWITAHAIGYIKIGGIILIPYSEVRKLVADAYNVK